MSIDEIASIELAYHVRKYMSEKSLQVGEFANLCDISMETLETALEPHPIAVSEMVKVCDLLAIPMETLRNPPKSEADYINFTNMILAISCSEMKFSEKKKAVKLECQKMNLGANQKRYFAWLEYEVSTIRISKPHPQRSLRLHNPAKGFLNHIQVERFASAAFTKKVSPRRKKGLESIIEGSGKDDNHNL